MTNETLEKLRSAAAVRRSTGVAATPGFLRLHVEDADAVLRQAVAAGGTSVPRSPTCSSATGSGVRDLLGNLYWIQTRVEDLSSQAMEGRLGDPEFTAEMEHVQSADFFPGRGISS